MGAPKNAEPLGFKGWIFEGKQISEDEARERSPGVNCPCGWHGLMGELLVDPDDKNPDSTMWCPECNTSGWIYD